MPFMLRFAALLLFAAAAQAAPGTWISSADLARQGKLTKLDRAGVAAILARLPKGVGMIKDYVDVKDATVLVHPGNLVVDGSFSNDDIVIVDGNLVVRGDYDDYNPGIGVLLVMGDFTVDDVLSWGSIAVGGTLESTGLVFANYNDFTFEVAGAVKARALVVSDKAGDTSSVDAAIVQTDGERRADAALRGFVPELMIDGLLENVPETFDDASAVDADADWGVANHLVHAGLPLFRDTPGPATLQRDALALMNPATDAAKVAKLAGEDRLLAMLAASREKVAPALQKQLLAQGDAAVLERLAANPGVDKSVLSQIAQNKPELSAVAAKNPKASASLLAPMAASGDPAVRIALLENANAPIAQVTALAADKEASVRLALAQSRHVRRLAAADVDRLVADPNADVRRALFGRGDVLGHAQLAKLAGDADAEVRQGVAESLAQQALWQRLPAGTESERASLATKLLGDAVVPVRHAAFAAATAAEQERYVASLDEKTRTRSGPGFARGTRSAALMRGYAKADAETARELARNLSLPPSVQALLVARLPPADKPRPRLSILSDPQAIVDAMQNDDAVVEELVRNANAAPATLDAVARYCKAARGNAPFCNALLDRDDLSAEVLDLLADVGDGEFREDWALTVLGAAKATRAQIVRAVPLWYDDDEDLLAAFKAGAKRGDDAAWLTSLAESRHEDLREIAAANAATPAAVLVKLRGDASEDVHNRASKNPSLPAEAMAKATEAPSWVLANPAIPDALVRKILAQAYAEDESTEADDALEVLAARALRVTEG